MRGWAFVVLLIAGCGDGRTINSDGGDGVDAAGGLVTVRVLQRSNTGDGDTSVGGLDVFFQYPDSQLALATRTLADGTANAYMREPGFVTVIESSSRFWTYVGAKPGDVLVLGATRPTPVINDLTIKIPAAPGATEYTLHTSCSIPELTSVNVTGGDNAQGISRPVNDCNNGTIDMLLLARQEFQAAGDRYIYRPDVAIAPLATVTIQGPYLSTSSTTTLVNVPAGIGYVALRQDLIGRARVYDSQQFGDSLIYASGGSGSTVTPMPHPEGTTIVSYLDDLGTFSRAGLDHVIEWGPASAVTTIDLGVDALPPFVGSPQWDAAAGAIVWRQSMTATVPESVVGDVAFGQPFNVPDLLWRVVAPFDANVEGESRLRLPVLPRATLQPPTEIATPSVVTLHSGRGYDHDRLHLLSWTPGARWPIEGATGRVSYQTFNANEL